jgi:hypothetical protein
VPVDTRLQRTARCAALRGSVNLSGCFRDDASSPSERPPIFNQGNLMRNRVLFVALALAVACGDTGVAEPSQHDQRAVTEAVLRHLDVLGTSEKPLFRGDSASISWLTSDPDSWQGASVLWPGVVSSFMDANAPGARHEPWLGSLGVGLIGAAEFQAYFSNGPDVDLRGGWERVLRGPPGCSVVVDVSVPGFSADGGQALISVGATRGLLNGSGGLYVLERQDGSWVVIKGLMFWDS